MIKPAEQAIAKSLGRSAAKPQEPNKAKLVEPAERPIEEEMERQSK